MSLHKVVLPNDYFEPGAFVEDGEDGFMQQVRVAQEGGRLKLGGYFGVCVPAELVRPFTIKILKRGFDDVGAHLTTKRPHSRRW